MSGLLYSTVFVNGSILGALPGYYNSGNGVTVNFTPTSKFYVNLGAYEGNLARGVQTGINPPEFNGYYFNIGEIGTNWTIGEGHHPGSSASAYGIKPGSSRHPVSRRMAPAGSTSTARSALRMV